MNRLFTLMLVFLWFHAFSQQDSLNRVDEQGLKQGPWKKTYEKGQTRYTGQFKNDKPVGKFIYYDLFGNKTTELIHSHDTAYATFFHVNEEVMGTGKYVNREKEGEWRYYDERGILSRVEYYQGGKLEGKVKSYYMDGQLAREATFKNGMETGPVVEYFPNGELKYEANHVDGNPDSTVHYYHPSGEVRMTGKYRDAVKHGKWIFYDDVGRLIMWRFYDLGRVVKTIKRNPEDGSTHEVKDETP